MENNSPKPIRCKAAVCRASGEPLLIEEIEVAPPKSFEVRIKIICTSVCHSDLTFWLRKDLAPFLPRILGHEAFGVVESLGERVKEMAVGDTVVPTFLSNCGECTDCRSEKSNFCRTVPFTVMPGMPRDGTVRFTDSEGRPLNNFLGVSSFSEYTVVDVAQVAKVDAALPPEKACLLSCGVSTGIGAAWKVARVEAGSSVVIFGLGAVGLTVAEGARLCGATKIIGVDVNPEKFVIGKKFGLTDFVNPRDDKEISVAKVIKDMTNGGADYCFECIGLASLMSDAFNSSRELHLDEFITHEMDFKDINQAFDLLVQGKSLRSIIWMDR